MARETIYVQTEPRCETETKDFQFAHTTHHPRYGHLLRYCVLFDNSTYFFNTFPAYYWCLVLPACMCWTGTIPFDYYFFTLVPGGFLWEILTYVEGGRGAGGGWDATRVAGRN